jgi:glycerol kinase
VGFWKGLPEIRSQWSEERRFKPAMRPDKRKELMAGWAQAVNCAKGWAKK